MKFKVHKVYKSYMASKCGEIRHISSSKNRSFRLDRDGYERFNISHNGKHISIKRHSFVAEIFCKKNCGKFTVNHIDGNKLNNCASNLEWVSASENTTHSFKTGLHKKNCHEVEVGGTVYYSKRECSRVTGINRYEL